MKKKKRLFNVYHVEKPVEPNGKVHLPKKFLDFLNIAAGNIVIVSLYEGDLTIRIRKKKHIYDALHAEKMVDQTGKVHIPKEFRDKLGIGAGNIVVVSLYEGYDEIRITKKRV